MQLCWLYLSALLIVPRNFHQVLSSRPLSGMPLPLIFAWLLSSFHSGLWKNIKPIERSLNMLSKRIPLLSHSFSVIIYYYLILHVYTPVLTFSIFFRLFSPLESKLIDNRDIVCLVRYSLQSLEESGTKELLNKHVELVNQWMYLCFYIDQMILQINQKYKLLKKIYTKWSWDPLLVYP